MTFKTGKEMISDLKAKVSDLIDESIKAAGFGCLDTEGNIVYTAPYEYMCHEHINDGINDFGLDDMAKLKVVAIFYKIDA